MSHGDTVVDVPPGFSIVGETDDCKVAAMEDRDRRLFGVQFHPEVVHTEHGHEILRNFVIDVCRCAADWDPRARLEQVIEPVSGNRRGTATSSSSSAAASTPRWPSISARRRSGPAACSASTSTPVSCGRATREAMRLSGAGRRARGGARGRPQRRLLRPRCAASANPERKRPIIGDAFVDVQEDEFAKLGLREGEWLLGQGTIYPDTIESGGARHAAKIKTHHNRAPRIQALIDEGRVIEPLVEFYKDEVRVLGEQLGLPHDVVWRHPFPGPGLAVRCVCADSAAAVERGVDHAARRGASASSCPCAPSACRATSGATRTSWPWKGRTASTPRGPWRAGHERAPQPSIASSRSSSAPDRCLRRARRSTRPRSRASGSRCCAPPTSW